MWRFNLAPKVQKELLQSPRRRRSRCSNVFFFFFFFFFLFFFVGEWGEGGADSLATANLFGLLYPKISCFIEQVCTSQASLSMGFTFCISNVPVTCLSVCLKIQNHVLGNNSDSIFYSNSCSYFRQHHVRIDLMLG